MAVVELRPTDTYQSVVIVENQLNLISSPEVTTTLQRPLRVPPQEVANMHHQVCSLGDTASPPLQLSPPPTRDPPFRDILLHLRFTVHGSPRSVDLIRRGLTRIVEQNIGHSVLCK